MKWGVGKGYRADNPGEAREKLLPRSNGHVKHRRALPHGEVAEALVKVRGSRAAPAAKLALEFAALTACRSNEVRRARWDEVDLEAAVWTIPAERMKAGREHRVPLSCRALEVLAAARALHPPGRLPLVFPAARGGAASRSGFVAAHSRPRIPTAWPENVVPELVCRDGCAPRARRALPRPRRQEPRRTRLHGDRPA